MKIPINGTLFTIKQTTGPLRRNGREFPVRICYASGEILLLSTLPESVKLDVLAAAISEAGIKHRIRLISPKWDKSL